MRIYIGNIGYSVTAEDLKKLFEKFGTVEKCALQENPDTGMNAGWALLDMPSEAEGDRAVEALNLKVFKGKKLKVAHYRPRSKDPNRPQFGKWVPR